MEEGYLYRSPFWQFLKGFICQYMYKERVREDQKVTTHLLWKAGYLDTVNRFDLSERIIFVRTYTLKI